MDLFLFLFLAPFFGFFFWGFCTFLAFVSSILHGSFDDICPLYVVDGWEVSGGRYSFGSMASFLWFCLFGGDA